MNEVETSLKNSGIGDLLREYRKLRKFSATKMAKFLGVPRETYVNWEYRGIVPNRAALKLIEDKVKSS